MPTFSARKVSTDIFTKKYRESQFEVLITLKNGRRIITILRGEVPKLLGTYHITAVKNLGLFLADKGVETVADLQRLSLEDFMVHGFGEAHLRVLLDLIDYVGGDVPSFCWWNTPGKKPTTFVGLKHKNRQKSKGRKRRR